MKEASRIQAVIEIISEVLEDTTPADIVMDKYLKSRRYIGAKDRRFITDFSWKIIRNRMHYTEMLGGHILPRLMVALALSDHDLDLFFNGEEYAPTELSKEEKKLLHDALLFEDFSDKALYECPQWLMEKFSDLSLLEKLNETAPLDVRANLTSRE
jgi:16S rRNA (cytosine967-C5)-methyltransferase